MHPNLGPVVLPSGVSPALLEMSLSARSFGLQCVADALDALDAVDAGPWVEEPLDQAPRSRAGSHVFDVDPLGNAGSERQSSSGSVWVRNSLLIGATMGRLSIHLNTAFYLDASHDRRRGLGPVRFVLIGADRRCDGSHPESPGISAGLRLP